jgi:hypothetical protein
MVKVLVLLSGIILIAAGLITLLGAMMGPLAGIALGLGLLQLLTIIEVLAFGVLTAGVLLLIEGARAK